MRLELVNKTFGRNMARVSYQCNMRTFALIHSNQKVMFLTILGPLISKLIIIIIIIIITLFYFGKIIQK